MFARFVTVSSIALAAFTIAVATMPIAMRVGRALGITAKRAAHLLGEERIPVFGGASIVASILIVLALWSALPLWILIGAGGLCIVGAIDDAWVMRPYQKMACQILIAASCAIFWLPRFQLTPWAAVDYAIAILWLVGNSNAYNLIDGLDGLAGGIGIIAAATIAATAILHNAPAVALPGLTIIGALSGFLIFNFPPASIFMGDAGALPVGFMLGALALSAGELATNSRLTKYIFPMLVMLVPLLDTGIVSITRIATGRSISRRGLDHSHHRLLSFGLTDRRALVVFWSVGSVAAACAFATGVLDHYYVLSALPFLILVAAVISLFMMDLTFESNPPGVAYGYAQGMARTILNLGYKQRIAEAAVDSALISASYFSAFMLRLNFDLNTVRMAGMVRGLPWVLMLTYPAFIVAGIYRGIWRYTSLSDGIRFVNGALLAGALMWAGAKVLPINHSGSIATLYAILLFNLLIVTRLSFQTLRKGIDSLAAPGKKVLVIGAGETGSAAANYISTNGRQGARLMGFVDDDVFLKGKLVHGTRVLGTIDDIERIYSVSPFDEILIADQHLPEGFVRSLSAFAKSRGVVVRRFSIGVADVATSSGLSESKDEPVARISAAESRTI